MAAGVADHIWTPAGIVKLADYGDGQGGFRVSCGEAAGLTTALAG